MLKWWSRVKNKYFSKNGGKLQMQHITEHTGIYIVPFKSLVTTQSTYACRSQSASSHIFMQHFTCFIYLASTSAVNLNSPINLVCLCVCVCAHENVCVAFRSRQDTAICTRKLTIFSFHLFSLHYSILLWLPHKELLDLIKCQCALCWTENRNPVFPLEDTEWNVSLLLPQRWIYCNYHFSKL